MFNSKYLLINLPLVWWTIAATFTISMLEFQRHLQTTLWKYYNKLFQFYFVKTNDSVKDLPQRHLAQCALFRQKLFSQHRPDQNHLCPVFSQLYIQESYLFEPERREDMIYSYYIVVFFVPMLY